MSKIFSGTEKECKGCGVKFIAKYTTGRGYNKYHSKECRYAHAKGRYIDGRSKDKELRNRYSKEYYAKIGKNYWLHRYGINLEKYEEMLRLQMNSCCICLKEFTATDKPFVDHNHRTGKVRGLVHNSCNAFVGRIRDRPDLALGLYGYLTNKSSMI